MVYGLLFMVLLTGAILYVLNLSFEENYKPQTINHKSGTCLQLN